MRGVPEDELLIFTGKIMKAIIALEDGTTFVRPQSFTGHGEAVGEIVFNTSMSGYQEVLTDPSYTGQIVTMTYPLIGNYGINRRTWNRRRSTPRPFCQGIQRHAVNYPLQQTLADFLGIRRPRRRGLRHPRPGRHIRTAER
jgi:carbamoyl-phosphate synthase small subunit